MSEIADKLIDWYGVNGRDLPWRRTRDPYRIWLSEVILQQTRIAQGMDYYLRFVARFPDVGALAAADEDEVLKLWQGLGYYSRARNLHAAARQVVERYGGRFPAAYADVRSLKGVGDYTAAAVCSIAYDAPCAVVDGNVYRVLSRLFDLDLAIDTAEAAKRSPRLPTNNSTGVGLHATTRRSWISARCNARPPTPPATTARCGTNACRWQPEP